MLSPDLALCSSPGTSFAILGRNSERVTLSSENYSRLIEHEEFTAQVTT